MKILFVEDSKTLQMIFTKKYLKDTPYAVDFAENGKLGYDMYMAGEYDVVLMDMEMPVMDGFEATRLIREHERETGREPVPIIAMTGHTDEDMVEETYRSGCTDYMQKPLDRSRLIELLEMYGKS